MKKLLLSFIVTLVIIPAAFAQRHCDIKVRLLSPDDGDEIYYNIPFQISVMVANNGIDTLRVSDTLKLALIFDGFPVEFSIGSANLDYLPLTNHELLPGDSSSFSMNFGVGAGWPTGPTNFCVQAIPANGADSINDPVPANNQSCITLKVVDPAHQGINSVSKAMPVVVYPNPAKDVANVELYMEKGGNVSFQLYDMTGKMVMSKEENVMQGGVHTINTNITEMPKGVYLYKVLVGDKVLKGKLEVQ